MHASCSRAQAFSPAAMDYKPPTDDRLKAKAAIVRNALVCNATVPRFFGTKLAARDASLTGRAQRSPSI